jgi:hypothetical protein
MSELLTTILSFPAVIYTVLLGVVVGYWLFVIVGAIDVNPFGHVDGAFEGATKGVIEGATKGAVEGIAKGGLDGGHVDGGEAGMLSALKLRSAPVTVVFSLVVTFGWLLCVLGMNVVGGSVFLSAVPGWLLKTLILVLATILAFPLTSIVARQLGKFFVVHPATQNKELVGKVCIVSTGEVDDRHGQATLDDGGAGLILQVRCDAKQKVKRGDRVLIVGWDKEQEGFLVEPMEDVLRENETKS